MRNKMIKKITIAGALLLGTSVIQAQHGDRYDRIQSVRNITLSANTDELGGNEGVSINSKNLALAFFSPNGHWFEQSSTFKNNITVDDNVTIGNNLTVGESNSKILLNGRVAIGGNNPLEGLHLYNRNLRIEVGEFQSVGKMVLRPDVNNSGDDKISFRNSANEEKAFIQNGKLTAESAKIKGDIDVHRLEVEGFAGFNSRIAAREGVLAYKKYESTSALVLHPASVNPANEKDYVSILDGRGEEHTRIHDGVITTNNVVLNVGSFPDYVFANDYDLMPLEEVASFIKKNKHLPNMPSEAEVVEKGMSVAQINTILVEKVEELTLHTIKQEEKINTLLKELQAIKEAVTATKK